MAKYRIEIDREQCVGDGLCCEEAPSTFELDDQDVAVVIDAEGDDPAQVLAAAKGCAVECITLYDVESNQKVWPEE